MSETTDYYVRCSVCNGSGDEAIVFQTHREVHGPCKNCDGQGYVYDSVGMVVPAALLEQAADVLEACYHIDTTAFGMNRVLRRTDPLELVAALRAAAGHGNAALGS